MLFRAAELPVVASKVPGEVTEVSDDGFTVASADGGLLVGRVQPPGSGKVMAGEWIKSVGLTPGARFGA